MIQFINASICYEHEQPIRSFNQQILEGEKIVFTGASGSGKSSLLNALMGFVPLCEGEILINEARLCPANINKIRQHFAFLPQELNLDLEYVKQLLLYPFEFKANHHLYPSNKQIVQILEQLLLEELILGKRLSEVSGGQKQRIALASVVMLKKPMLILDEPTSALDDHSAEAVVSLVRSLKNTTVISASHDLRWIESMDTQIKL